MRSAFTLTEFLVAIAILALLLAIVMPSLSRARDAARDAACMANLRSVGQCIHGYGEDWHTFPAATGPQRGTEWWLTAIGCDRNAATCPRDHNRGPVDYAYPIEAMSDLDRLWREHTEGEGREFNLVVLGDREPWHDGKSTVLVLGRQLDSPVLASKGSR